MIQWIIKNGSPENSPLFAATKKETKNKNAENGDENFAFHVIF